MSYDAQVDPSYSGREGLSVGATRRYRCLTTALNGAPAHSIAPYAILITAGRYCEKLVVDKPFITLLGQDRDQTIITFGDAAGTKNPDGTMLGTTGSATVTVRATDFHAENLTIENEFDYPANAAKPSSDSSRVSNTQAVALKTEYPGDRLFFQNVAFVGYQDTLYVDAGRHLFLQCAVSGHVDFIFGAGRAVFDDCDLVSRQPGYITAASTLLTQPYGFLFQNCRLKKENPTLADGTVALGRPWHPTRDLPDGSRAADPAAVGSVMFKNCWMDSHISVKRWEPMSGRDREGRTTWFYPADARFCEYGSTGPGAPSHASRAPTEIQVEQYSRQNLLDGWDPQR